MAVVDERSGSGSAESGLGIDGVGKAGAGGVGIEKKFAGRIDGDRSAITGVPRKRERRASHRGESAGGSIYRVGEDRAGVEIRNVKKGASRIDLGVDPCRRSRDGGWRAEGSGSGVKNESEE